MARRAAALGWEATAARLLGPDDPDYRLLIGELIAVREEAVRDRFLAEQEMAATALGVQGQVDVVDGLIGGG